MTRRIPLYLTWLALGTVLAANAAWALPDLVVDEVEIYCTGDNTLFLSATIANNGSSSASGFSLSVFLSSDILITLGDALVRTSPIASVAAGSSTTVTGVAGVPITLLPGVYFAGAIVDSTFQIVESNELNNIGIGNQLNTPCNAGAPSIRVDAKTLEFIEQLGEKSYGADGAEPGILLQNRTIDTSGGAKTASAEGYTLVRLAPGVEPSAIEALGGEIVHPVPVRAFAVYFPEPTQMPADSGIEWFGPILPSDKRSPYAEKSSAAHAYIVDVFPNVSDEIAAHLLDIVGDVDAKARLGEHSFLVRDVASLDALAAIDEVSWIAPAPDAVLAGLPVLVCPGPITPWGAVPKFAVQGNGWDGTGLRSTSLTYRFKNDTPDVPGLLEHQEVVRALATWADVIDVHLTEASLAGQNKCIEIAWETGAHGDGSPFDGPGGILGHAFYPASTISPETIAGDVHLDDAEFWQIGSGIDVYSVALHELGHALGLGHSANPAAVMSAVYVPGTIYAGLRQDDLNGILTLYPSALTWDSFRINNDGASSLTIFSIDPAGTAPWIQVSPQPPFQIPAYSSAAVQVSVDYDMARAFLSPSRSLYVSSNDAAKSPYPDPIPVHITPAFTPNFPIRPIALVLLVGAVVGAYMTRHRVRLGRNS